MESVKYQKLIVEVEFPSVTALWYIKEHTVLLTVSDTSLERFVYDYIDYKQMNGLADD